MDSYCNQNPEPEKLFAGKSKEFHINDMDAVDQVNT